ncbi:MAG TPA: metalloregulator ArsR/SmtB family transcription factor [Acidobacteriota bacterium]|nr:metalloregulator ArsR/SmtB family transcription factor [Acidobacteriota bacterium]
MKEDVTTQVFRALADPTRRAILQKIASKPLHVAQLKGNFEISRPAISKHLRILKNAGLVTFTEEGKKRMYRLQARPLRYAYNWLDHYRSFWTESLRNLKKHVESRPPASKRK